MTLGAEGSAGSRSPLCPLLTVPPLPAAGKGGTGRTLSVGTQLGPRLDRRGGLNLAFDLKESLNVFQLLISRLKILCLWGAVTVSQAVCHPWVPTKCLKRGQAVTTPKIVSPKISRRPRVRKSRPLRKMRTDHPTPPFLPSAPQPQGARTDGTEEAGGRELLRV